MSKVVALIQARMGARRLPNKVLLKLGGRTVLEHVIYRVAHARLVDDLAVVTTVELDDLKIVEVVSRLGVRVLCGSQDDVLDRYYQAARLLNAEHVVRITADCPLMDPAVIDQVVDSYFETKADYCSNALTQTFPDGLDVEVFSFKALTDAWKNAHLISQREHVTPYIREHRKKFKIVSLEHPENLGSYRWTLDEKKDYLFLQKVFAAFEKSKNVFGMQDVLNFLEKNPQFSSINSNIQRNEGYALSLKNDKVVKNG